jgi:hypothetical protein
MKYNDYVMKIEGEHEVSIVRTVYLENFINYLLIMCGNNLYDHIKVIDCESDISDTHIELSICGKERHFNINCTKIDVENLLNKFSMENDKKIKFKIWGGELV